MTLAELKARTAARKAAGTAPGMAGAGKSAKAVLPAPATCPYRGEPTGETVACASCRGKRVEMRVYACSKFGRCILGTKEVPGAHLCGG